MPLSVFSLVEPLEEMMQSCIGDADLHHFVQSKSGREARSAMDFPFHRLLQPLGKLLAMSSEPALSGHRFMGWPGINSSGCER